ncbi:MAG TPA: transglycosylase SLT domain-containing protein [Burkholderiales bacterium]
MQVQTRLLFALVLVSAVLGGCGTTFDAPHRAMQAGDEDETISWWRRPDHSGIYAAMTRPILVPVPLQVADVAPPPPKDVLERLRRGFAIPDLNTARVRQREAWFIQRPELVKRIFDRSSSYLYYIVEEVEKRHLPTELALLPFIESGYDPRATSIAQAAGIWQFVPSTAARYKLKIDPSRDDRRDVVASTAAALDYLEGLYKMFGDWHLVLASYNCGENAVQRAIDRNRAQGRSISYEHLQLPEETQDYLPKLQAIEDIVRNPALISLPLPHLPNEPYFTFAVAPSQLKVSDAARFAGMNMDDFVLLNTAYTNNLIPPKERIVLPLDRVPLFEKQANQRPASTGKRQR